MKWKMIVCFMLVAMVLTMAVGLALNITHLNIINKTDKEIFVKFVQVDNPQNSFTRQLVPATLEADTEDIVSIVSGTYFVWAWARTRDVDQTGHYVYGDYINCYGFADDAYWDKNKAARVIKFGKGLRKLPFSDKSCQFLPETLYKYWDNLPLMEFKYKLNQFSYKY